MASRRVQAALLAVAILSAHLTGTCGGPAQRVRSSYESQASNQIQHDPQENEIEDYFQISEPYKAMIKSGARIALGRSSLATHVNVDATVDALGQAASHLSKPSNLIKAILVAVPSFLSMLLTVMLVPGAHEIVESFRREPTEILSLDRHLNATVDRLREMGAEDLIAKIGLNESICLERSICNAVMIVKKSFPGLVDMIRSWTNRLAYLGGTSLNKKLKSYSTFLDQDCSNPNITNSQVPYYCLANFLSPLVSLTNDTRPNDSHKPMFQKLQAPRA